MRYDFTRPEASRYAVPGISWLAAVVAVSDALMTAKGPGMPRVPKFLRS
jgi:hypothetical protein